jgi:hypothetical protein
METGVQTSSLPVTNSASPCPPDVPDSAASLAAPREIAISVGKRDKEVRSEHLGKNVVLPPAPSSSPAWPPPSPAQAWSPSLPSWLLSADWQNVQHGMDRAIRQAARRAPADFWTSWLTCPSTPWRCGWRLGLQKTQSWARLHYH